MNKNLTQQQVRTILDGAPKDVNPDKLIQGLVDSGYILQGLNDQPQKVQKQEPTSGVTNKGIQDAYGQTKAFIGGAGDILGGGLVNSAIQYGGEKLVNAFGTDQMKQNVASAPTLNEKYQNTFGAGEHPTAYGAGEVVAGVASAVPLAAEQGAKLLATTKGKQLADGVSKVVNTVKEAGKNSIKALDESLPVKGNAKDDFILDLISPKATEAVKQEALAQGRVTEPGLLTKGKITPSKRDTQVLEAVKGFVSDSSTPKQNIDSIQKGVSSINEGVKSYARENKVPFNTNQLKSQLNKGKEELNLIFASDTMAKKTYNAVVKEFVKHVKSKDTAGLIDARQSFDKIPAIKKLLQSQGLGENTKKEVVLTVRDMANKYVANLLPEGNQYRSSLLRESKMIEAIGNIADKNTGIIDQNKLQILIKNNPILRWVIGGATTGIIGAGIN